MKNSIKIILTITLILSIMNLNFLSVYADDIAEEPEYEFTEELIETNSNVKEEPNIFSKNAVIYDRKSKTILYGKNENNRVPMASTTKIMTAIVLMEELEKNNELSLSSQIEVCKKAAAIGGSRLGLKTGDKITLNDLIYGLMLKSRK